MQGEIFELVLDYARGSGEVVVFVVIELTTETSNLMEERDIITDMLTWVYVISQM